MDTIKTGHYAKWVMIVHVVSSLIVSATSVNRSSTHAATPAGKYDWLQFGFDEEKSADNTLETTIPRDMQRGISKQAEKKKGAFGEEDIIVCHTESVLR